MSTLLTEPLQYVQRHDSQLETCALKVAGREGEIAKAAKALANKL